MTVLLCGRIEVRVCLGKRADRGKRRRLNTSAPASTYGGHDTGALIKVNEKSKINYKTRSTRKRKRY